MYTSQSNYIVRLEGEPHAYMVNNYFRNIVIVNFYPECKCNQGTLLFLISQVTIIHYVPAFRTQYE